MRRYTIQQNSVGNILVTDLDNEDGSFTMPYGATPTPKKSKNKVIFKDTRGVNFWVFDAEEVISLTDKNGTVTVINNDVDLLYDTLTGTFFFNVGFIPTADAYPRVNSRNDLPTDVLEAPIGSLYMTINPVFNLFTNGQSFKQNPAGLYHRDTGNGNLNDWRAIPFKTTFTDLEFRLANDLVRGKQSREDLTLITDGETRVYQKPNKSGIYALLDDLTDFETGTELDARDVTNRNRANHTGSPSVNVSWANNQLKNLGAPTDLNDAVRDVDSWEVGIYSELGLINQQADPNFEPFFIREPLPNVNQANGVWTITPPFTGQLELVLSGVCSYNQNTSDILIHILRDGTIFDFPYHIEPKDTGGGGVILPIVQNDALTGATTNSETNQFMHFGGNKLIPCSIGQPITLRLEFCGDNAGQEATIYSACVIAKRFRNKNV